MSAGPHTLSEQTSLQPTGLCPPNPFPRLRRAAVTGRLESRIHDLAIVLDRLFTFHEAMRLGRPVADGDEMLAQVGAVVTRSMKSTTAR